MLLCIKFYRVYSSEILKIAMQYEKAQTFDADHQQVRKTRLGKLFKWGAPIQFENSSFSNQYIKINSASTALYSKLLKLYFITSTYKTLLCFQCEHSLFHFFVHPF